jgi:hypothetical protein
MCRTDLRDRVVRDAAALRWIVGGLDGSAARHLHGWYVRRQLDAVTCDLAKASPAQGVCRARARRGRVRTARAGPAADRRIRVSGDRRSRHAGLPAPRRCRGDLPAPSDIRDGRDASRDRTLGRDDTAWSELARIFLRWQYGGRRDRLHRDRLLFAPRHGCADDDVRCGCDQHRRGGDRVLSLESHAGERGRASMCRPERILSTPRSRSRE